MSRVSSDQQKREEVEKKLIRMEASQKFDMKNPNPAKYSSDAAYGRAEDLRQLAQVQRIADREAEQKEDIRQQQQAPQNKSSSTTTAEKKKIPVVMQYPGPNANDPQSRQARHYLARQEPVRNNDWNQDVIFEKKPSTSGEVEDGDNNNDETTAAIGVGGWDEWGKLADGPPKQTK